MQCEVVEPAPGTFREMAYEAKDYPIFGMMFHPETANRHVVGLGRDMLTGKVNNEVTDEINFRFSEFFHG